MLGERFPRQEVRARLFDDYRARGVWGTRTFDRVLEEGCGGDFSLEPLDDLFIDELPGQDHFHRDNAAEAQLSSLVHDAHAAAGDLLDQFVIAKPAERR